MSLPRLRPFNRLPRAEPFPFPLLRLRKPGRFDNTESFIKRGVWRTASLAGVDLGLLANGFLIRGSGCGPRGGSIQQISLVPEPDWEHAMHSVGA